MSTPYNARYNPSYATSMYKPGAGELLTPIQREMLCEVSRASEGKEYTGEPNPDLEEIIEALHRQSPEKFHTKDTLATRRFINEPNPYAVKSNGHIHHASPSQHEAWATAWDPTRRIE